MPRSLEQQALIDKLIEFLKPYKGKTIGTDVLAAKIAEIYKGKLGKNSPAKQLANLRKSSPEVFKDVKIETFLAGKLDRYYNSNPEFQKFYKEKYEDKNGKWKDISVADRTIKKNSIKTFKLDLERKKVIPNNYIRNSSFSEKIGVDPDTFRTMRTRDSYKALTSKINKIAKPKNFNKELYFKDPSSDEISKIKNLIQENKQAGVKSMAEKKQSVSYEPIRAIHKELIRDPDATPTELAEAIYGKANAKNLRNVGNDASMYVEFLSGSRKVPGITAPTVRMSESILGNILMPGSGFFNFGNSERRNAMLKERDKILKITDPNNRLFTTRNRLLRNLRGQGFNVDEAMGLSATYERAPGYSELAQITSPEVNYIKGNTIDRDFSRIFDKVVRGEQNLGSEIKKFNQDSKAFQKTYNVDTPIIEFKPGEKLDASKFVKNFDKLTPEAQANVSQLADQGIALRSKAMPMGALLESVANLKPGSKAFRTVCTITRAEGGSVDACVERVAQEPEKFANKFKNLTAESGPLAKVKNAALGFLKSPGVKTFGIGAGVGAAVGLVKLFRNDDPTTYLSNEDQQKSMLVDMATQPISTDIERPAILDYQLPALGATIAGSTIAAAPSTIKASQSRSLGVERKKPTGTVKTGLRVLGRGLGVAASPALLAPFAAGDIASQVAAGDSATDIATNPFNYLYPAFADQTPKLTRGLNPTLRKVARLGLPKLALRGLSRAGIGGFAASSVIQGLGLLDE